MISRYYGRDDAGHNRDTHTASQLRRTYIKAPASRVDAADRTALSPVISGDKHSSMQTSRQHIQPNPGLWVRHPTVESASSGGDRCYGDYTTQGLSPRLASMRPLRMLGIMNPARHLGCHSTSTVPRAVPASERAMVSHRCSSVAVGSCVPQ
jgi:hypothetical protein